MKNHWTPLVSTLGIAAMIAGCGGQQTAATAPSLGNSAENAPAAAMKLDASGTDVRRPVTLHYRDRAQLDALAHSGVDLFENVDDEHHTVGATLNEKTSAVVKQMGVQVDDLYMAQGFPSGYQTVDHVYADMKKMAAAHPHFIQLVTFGKSLQGRPMMALRFSANRDKGLPSIRLGSGIHARELPPVEIMSRFAHTLADGYGHDATITKLVNTKEIWMVLEQNPDGRVKVERGSSMWRKNARQDYNSPQGVDCNRNADDHFSQGDANPYADDYKGASGFSEPESQALRDLTKKHPFDVSLDMHCFAGMLLWPPGYDYSYSKDEASFSRIGKTMAQMAGGYKAGTIAQTIYQSYGDFATWEYVNHRTLAFATELNCNSFSPAYSTVDGLWAKWKPTLLYLVGQTTHQGAH